MKIHDIKNKVIELGILNILLGLIKKKQYTRLQKKYLFDQWHLSPFEFRRYAIDIVSYLTKIINNNNTIVEIGCGLGNILTNIAYKNKNKSLDLYGFDISPQVIAAAKEIDRNHSVSYSVGSFDNIKGMKIDFLITVNFIHNISKEALSAYYKKITTENDITNIIAEAFYLKNFFITMLYPT